MAAGQFPDRCGERAAGGLAGQSFAAAKLFVIFKPVATGHPAQIQRQTLALQA
jgi:hypothetical protein